MGDGRGDGSVKVRVPVESPCAVSLSLSLPRDIKQQGGKGKAEKAYRHRGHFEGL